MCTYNYCVRCVYVVTVCFHNSSDENVSANIQHECPTTPITTNGPYTLHSVISHLGDESAYGENSGCGYI